MKKEFTIEEWRKDQGQKVVNNKGEEINPNEKTLGWLMVHKLYIVEEPELSEFEDGLRIICENAVKEAHLFPHRTSEDFAKKHAAELLNLARKELCEQIVDHTKEAYENGKAEALKDLPRWRKWGNGACGNSDGHPIALVSGAGGIRFVSVLGVTGETYIMLDDLKKLPGFNEK